MLNEIEKTIVYYTSRITRVSKDLDPDDVRQSFYEKALRLKSKYDGNKACMNTFVTKAIKNKAVDLQRREIRMKENLFYTDFSNFEISYNPMRKIHIKLYLDVIEIALQKTKGAQASNALKVFKLMREGYSQIECSKELNFSTGYVSRLFHKFIKPIGRKALT